MSRDSDRLYIILLDPRYYWRFCGEGEKTVGHSLCGLMNYRNRLLDIREFPPSSLLYITLHLFIS